MHSTCNTLFLSACRLCLGRFQCQKLFLSGMNSLNIVWLVSFDFFWKIYKYKFDRDYQAFLCVTEWNGQSNPCLRRTCDSLSMYSTTQHLQRLIEVSQTHCKENLLKLRKRWFFPLNNKHHIKQKKSNNKEDPFASPGKLAFRS